MSPKLFSMLLVFVASVIGSLGMAFLKMGSAKTTSSPLSYINRHVILGVALFLGSSVFYAWGIKNGQLSVLYPMVSLGYIWGLWWAKIFFNEPITRDKSIGLGLILIGVTLVSMGG
jgi:uncharacterized membrane protein